MSVTDLNLNSTQSEQNTYRCSIKNRSPQSWLMFALAHIVCRATTVARGNTVHSRFQEPVAMQPTEYFPNQTMPSPQLIFLAHINQKLRTINMQAIKFTKHVSGTFPHCVCNHTLYKVCMHIQKWTEIYLHKSIHTEKNKKQNCKLQQLMCRPYEKPFLLHSAVI